jgi:hypothetical protein
MTEENQSHPKKSQQNSDLPYTTERIKMKYKIFKLIAYKLVNGQTAITTRQMAISVCKTANIVERFLERRGVSPIKVILPNHLVADMIPLSIAVDFWKYLNNSGRGNTLTKLGQKYLDQNIVDSPK